MRHTAVGVVHDDHGFDAQLQVERGNRTQRLGGMAACVTDYGIARLSDVLAGEL